MNSNDETLWLLTSRPFNSHVRLAGGSAGGDEHCALRESPEAYQPFSAFIDGFSGGSSVDKEKKMIT